MTESTQLITSILAFLTLIADIVVVAFVIGFILKKIGIATPLFNGMAGFFGRNAILLGFFVALGSMLGSLYYSDIVGFVPCALCWWQRVFMYPQVLLFGMAFRTKDERVIDYGLWLSIIGGIIALYSTFLQFGGSLLPCPATGVSCSLRYFLEFGYVTIPTMSLTGFALVVILMLARKGLNPAANLKTGE